MTRAEDWGDGGYTHQARSIKSKKVTTIPCTVIETHTFDDLTFVNHSIHFYKNWIMLAKVEYYFPA